MFQHVITTIAMALVKKPTEVASSNKKVSNDEHEILRSMKHGAFEGLGIQWFQFK
ncbi:hypothetical protein Fmac_032289 [Flemingia macrophylla]|uniref:Uncharacterized protein n=1 Tax=Flemingia macrophylla TaxID=520843 RepID=A0ABD1L4Y8_9FABA